MNRMIGRGRRLDLVDHRFEPVFKLALDARPGLQQSQVQRPQGHVLQRRGHVAGRDAQGKAFDHRRLAHARLAGEDRIVLPPPGQDVDDLPDFRIASQHRIDVPAAGAGRQVDRVLIQCGRLGGAERLARRRSCRPCRRLGHGRLAGLVRVGDDRGKIPVQRVSRNLLQFPRSLAGDTGQHFVRQERTQQVPGADLRCAEFDRSDHPGLADQVHDLRRQTRRPGVARLQPVDGRRHRARHAGGVDLEMPQQRGDVRIVSLQQLEQPVLQLHVVIRPRQTQARRALQGPAAGFVQLGDQRFQIDGYHDEPFKWSGVVIGDR